MDGVGLDFRSTNRSSGAIFSLWLNLCAFAFLREIFLRSGFGVDRTIKILQFERIILAKTNFFCEVMTSPPILVRRRSPGWLIDDSPDQKLNYSYGTPGNGFFVGFTPLRPHLLLAGRISNRCIGSTRL